MSQSDYLRFLIAAESDPDLKAALRRASAMVRTLDDLVVFGARHGFRFGAADIPVNSNPEARERPSGAAAR